MYTQKKYTRDGEAAMNHKPEGLFKLVATDLYVPGVFPPEGSEKVRQAIAERAFRPSRGRRVTDQPRKSIAQEETPEDVQRTNR